MLLHYFKTVIRNLTKQRLNSAINILGLSLGLGISLLIWIFVIHQLSFDRFFSDYSRIYRVNTTVEAGQGEPRTVPRTMFFLAQEAYDNLPQIESFCRFTTFWASPEVIIDDKPATLSGILLGDENFFSIFDFAFLAGMHQILCLIQWI
jgi:putative ABC transport system permease protein